MDPYWFAYTDTGGAITAIFYDRADIPNRLERDDIRSTRIRVDLMSESPSSYLFRGGFSF